MTFVEMAEAYRCPIYPDLAGKTALIMGIGQTKVPNSLTWGNGAAMARILSHNGVKLFGSDLNIEAAQYTASRLREEVKGCLVEVMAADGTNESDVKEVVKKMVADERFGRIDLLINNVGKCRPIENPDYDQQLCSSPAHQYQHRHDGPWRSCDNGPITVPSTDRSQSQDGLPVYPCRPADYDISVTSRRCYRQQLLSHGHSLHRQTSNWLCFSKGCSVAIYQASCCFVRPKEDQS